QALVQLVQALCFLQAIVYLRHLVQAAYGILLCIVSRNLHLRQYIKHLCFLVREAKLEVRIGQSQDGLTDFHHRTIFYIFFFHTTAFLGIQVNRSKRQYNPVYGDKFLEWAFLYFTDGNSFCIYVEAAFAGSEVIAAPDQDNDSNNPSYSKNPFSCPF